MAWTAPRTWVTAETVTAALMNAEIRDNFLETSAATVTTAGDIAFADAANSMGSRVALGAANTHLVSDGSAPVWRGITSDADEGSGTRDAGMLGTDFVSLDTGWGFTGEIEVTVTTGTEALVLFKAFTFGVDTAGALIVMSYAVSGATTVAASDTHAMRYESSNANDTAGFGAFDLRAGLTAGSNTFTLEAKANVGIGAIARPEIAVIAF